MNAIYRTSSARSQLYAINRNIVDGIINVVTELTGPVVKQELANTEIMEYIVERNIYAGILPQHATSRELQQLMMNVGVQRSMLDVTVLQFLII